MRVDRIGKLIFVGLNLNPLLAQTSKYPPLSDYMMNRAAEISLAKSAAPASISDRATIEVLSATGYQLAHTGDNGFTCLVMRGWAAPTFTPAKGRDLVYDTHLRAPICFDPIASRTVLPYYELRSRLGMERKTPDEITREVEAAYTNGTLPKRDAVSFAYMFSADQDVGGGYGHWHPHMMVFCPYYTNPMLGGNPFGGNLPLVTDDAGTPFALVIIAVDDRLAIKPRPE